MPTLMYAKAVTAVLIATIALSAQGVTQGDRAPDWTGTDIASGTTINFPAITEGKPAVLIFWATWCPYCKAFMPYAKKIESDYREKGVKIITFNTKERGRGDPAAYIAGLDFPLIAIENADAIGDLYDIPFIPGLLVVDETGQIAYRRKSTNLPAGKTVSQQWDAEVRKVLDQLTE